MLRESVRRLHDAFRAPRASAEDEVAFEAYLRSRVARFGCAAAIILNVLQLVFWPTDRFLLVPDPAVLAATRWFRVTTFANHTVFFALLSRPSLYRWAVPLFTLGMLVSCALCGSAMAQLGRLDQPYFHMMYIAPLVTIAVPLRLPARLVANVLAGATITAAYLLTRPSELASPYVAPAAGCMVFAVAASTCYGVLQFNGTRATFLHQRALARSAEALRGYSERLEELVAEHVGQIRRLAVHAERVAEAERERLSRELHDEMGQQITAMRYTLSFVRARFHKDPEGAHARLADLEAILAELAAGVRHMVTELRPRVLDDRGLPAAIEWLVQHTRQRSGLPCDLSLSIDASTEVSRDLAAAAFRIVQESLTNAVRHANARRLSVALEVDGGGVHAQVEDDGCGAEPVPPSSRGMGVLGMRERARAHGGSFSIESRPGAGTKVSVHLPFAPGVTP